MNIDAVLVTHDKRPEFGKGVVLGESYPFEGGYYAVKFENIDFVYNVAIENLSLLENTHEH